MLIKTVSIGRFSLKTVSRVLTYKKTNMFELLTLLLMLVFINFNLRFGFEK
jgi:hypothetical protein